MPLIIALTRRRARPGRLFIGKTQSGDDAQCSARFLIAARGITAGRVS